MLFCIVYDLNEVAGNVIFEAEMNEAHLALKVASFTGASVVDDYSFLVLALVLLVLGSIGGIFGYPLEEILECVVFSDYLGIDSHIADLREEFLAYGVGSDISELPVENKIAVCTEFIYLLLNAQINVIDRRSGNDIIKYTCAEEVEERNQIVLDVKDTSCQIYKDRTQKGSCIDHHDPEGGISSAEICQDRKECCKADFHCEDDVSDVIEKSGFLEQLGRISRNELQCRIEKRKSVSKQN